MSLFNIPILIIKNFESIFMYKKSNDKIDNLLNKHKEEVAYIRNITSNILKLFKKQVFLKNKEKLEKEKLNSFLKEKEVSFFLKLSNLMIKLLSVEEQLYLKEPKDNDENLNERSIQEGDTKILDLYLEKKMNIKNKQDIQ